MTINYISEIKSGNTEALNQLYKNFRNEFIRWAIARYQVSIDESKDIFQDLVIDFYQNVNSGKLTELTCDIKTYLFQLGKYKLINKIKKDQHQFSYRNTFIGENQNYSDTISVYHDRQHTDLKLTNYLNLLCDKCRAVIELFYIHELSLKEVATIVGYKNEDVAKKKRYECFKKLKEIYNKQNNVRELR